MQRRAGFLLTLGLVAVTASGCQQPERAKVKRFPAWPQNVGPVAFTPDGHTLLVGVNNTVQLWNMESHEQRASLHDQSMIETMTCSPDGKTLATGSYWGAIRLWDLATAKEKSIVREGHGDLDGDRPKPRDCWYNITFLAYGPDGKTLTYVAGNMEAHRYHFATGQRKDLDWLKGRGRPAALSPDGESIACDAAPDVKLFGLPSGKEKRAFPGHWVVSGLAFSPDGKLLASVSGGNEGTSVLLWDLTTGKLKLSLEGHVGPPTRVAFSPDGRTLASGSSNIRLWEVGSGKPRKAFLAGWHISAIVFSPDGTHLAVVSDRRLQLWDLATGQRLDDGPPGRRLHETLKETKH
jgi:WD40 repeat protein